VIVATCGVALVHAVTVICSALMMRVYGNVTVSSSASVVVVATDIVVTAALIPADNDNAPTAINRFVS